MSKIKAVEEQAFVVIVDSVFLKLVEGTVDLARMFTFVKMKLKFCVALIVTIFSHGVASAALPPDPGEDGRKTLVGVDSNHNNVRDDVERWVKIRLSLLNSTQKEKVLMQLAEDYQALMSAEEDNEKIVKAYRRALETRFCGILVLKDSAESEMNGLLAQFMNTADRSKRWIYAIKLIAEESFSLPSEDKFASYCRFQVTQ